MSQTGDGAGAGEPNGIVGVVVPSPIGKVHSYSSPAELEQLKAMVDAEVKRQPPSAEHIMQFFAYAHLPPKLALVSKPFGVLAEEIVLNLPRNPERTVALRKLLEAKDAAVRAFIAVLP